MRFLLTVLLSTAIVCLVFPHVAGVSFAGGILAACGFALATAGTAAFMKTVGRALTLTLRITTVLPAVLVLLPVWLLGVWLLPALELKMFAAAFPQAISFQGWGALLSASALLLAPTVLTHRWSETLKKPCECR